MSAAKKTYRQHSVRTLANKKNLLVDQFKQHEQRTKTLMIRALILWLLASMFIPLFVESLNQVTLWGFPLGWLITTKGVLLVFVILCFWYAKKQDKIDKECKLSEEEI
ncbi:MAG: DUF4212 domain-containing protein [Alphaproteobacteria bacterium]